MVDCDILIVGGGIAGASLGAELARECKVVVAEAESHCGMHSTGRSAAFWLGSYGGPEVAPLTAASRAFLDHPPEEFSDRGFLRTRGAVHISRAGEPPGPEGPEFRLIGRGELEQRIPGIAPDWQRGMLEPSCADIDVGALHQAYLRQLRAASGRVLNDRRMTRAAHRNGRWSVEFAGGGSITCATLVNAAGAWADEVAAAAGVQPIGIAPKRRTMLQLAVGRSGLRSLPLVLDTAGTFYFKGESDRSIWLSPHDEIATHPCDAAAEEMDVAVAIDRFQSAVDWPVERVERSWAGLRSFAPDRVPVYGFDSGQPAFFWCAGQGGFGIQTAPAAARLSAALLLGSTPDPMTDRIRADVFSPDRFSRSG